MILRLVLTHLLVFSRLGRSLKLGILQTNGNSSELCTAALKLAKAEGECVNDEIEILYREGCVPKRPAKGTVNAAEMHFYDNVNAFIGPQCMDETYELGRLAYFWKKPLFSRTMANKKMMNVQNYPTVIGLSSTTPAGVTKTIYELYKKLNDGTLKNITLIGPSARTGDHYPLAQAINDYLQLNGLMKIGYFGLFDEYHSFPTVMREAMERTGSQFLVVAADFSSVVGLSRVKLDDLSTLGFVPIVVFPKPYLKIDEAEKSEIINSQAIFINNIVPNLTDAYGPIQNEDSNDILGSFNEKMAMFLSCYAYCYGSKHGTTGETRDYYTVFKNKKITNKLGTFSFDASGSLMSDYIVSMLTTEADPLLVTTSTSLSSCQGYDCFTMTSVDAKSADFWKQLQARKKLTCTFDNSCTTSYAWLLGVAGGVLVVITLYILHRWRKTSRINMYRMHWKIKRENLKIIENKQSSKTKAGDNSLSTKRRNISSYALVGTVKAEFIALKQTRKIKWTRPELKYLYELKLLNHDNLTKFMGICCNDLDNFFILQAMIERASLEDFIKDSEFNMDSTFKSAFIRDIMKGLSYLHKSSIGYHGMLTSTNCLIDNNWVLKLSNFGVASMLSEFVSSGTLFTMELIPLSNYVFFPPELLKGIELGRNYPKGSAGGDIYCFGMIIYQLIYRNDPYESFGYTQKDLINHIINKGLKPNVTNLDQDPLIDMMIQCWNVSPDARPKLRHINQTVASAFSSSKGQLVDQMMKMNEKYAQNLEKIVEERNNMLQEAQEQTMRLLNELLPKSISAVLKTGGTVPPRSYDFATVLFVQVCDFPVLVGKSGPEEVIQFLNDVYDTFDTIINKHDAYKVETTGETYMVASGVPNENDGRHIVEIAEISLEIRDASYVYVVAHCPEFIVRVKIGFHCGPIAAGVIGIRSPRYCLFGDTVNFASRMQSNCPPNQIQTSEVTALRLMEACDEYSLVKRGIVQVKGKGAVNCYWLNEHIHEEHPPKTAEERKLASRLSGKIK